MKSIVDLTIFVKEAITLMGNRLGQIESTLTILTVQGKEVHSKQVAPSSSSNTQPSRPCSPHKVRPPLLPVKIIVGIVLPCPR